MVEPSLNIIMNIMAYYGTSCNEWWHKDYNGLSSNIIIISWRLPNLQRSTDPSDPVKSTKMLQESYPCELHWFFEASDPTVLNHEVVTCCRVICLISLSCARFGLDLQCCSATPAGSGRTKHEGLGFPIQVRNIHKLGKHIESRKGSQNGQVGVDFSVDIRKQYSLVSDAWLCNVFAMQKFLHPQSVSPGQSPN